MAMLIVLLIGLILIVDNHPILGLVLILVACNH